MPNAARQPKSPLQTSGTPPDRHPRSSHPRFRPGAQAGATTGQPPPAHLPPPGSGCLGQGNPVEAPGG
eukprot:2489632-Lingulodinium_polyedra.AAC.1